MYLHNKSQNYTPTARTREAARPFVRRYNSMKLFTLLLLTTIFMLGCASPESRKDALLKKAEPCLHEVSDLNESLSCLKGKGYIDWTQYKNTYRYHSCGPYWGYPFMASCSSITIEHSNGQIKSYNLWSGLDGI